MDYGRHKVEVEKESSKKPGDAIELGESVSDSMDADWTEAAKDREEYRNSIRHVTTTSPLRRANDRQHEFKVSKVSVYERPISLSACLV